MTLTCSAVALSRTNICPGTVPWSFRLHTSKNLQHPSRDTVNSSEVPDTNRYVHHGMSLHVLKQYVIFKSQIVWYKRLYTNTQKASSLCLCSRITRVMASGKELSHIKHELHALVHEYWTAIGISLICICTKRRPSWMRSEASVEDDDDDDISLLYLTLSNRKCI